MNYSKYDIICCKRWFYLLICNELSFINLGDKLLIITNTMNLITILKPSNLNVFFMVTFYSVRDSTCDPHKNE